MQRGDGRPGAPDNRRPVGGSREGQIELLDILAEGQPPAFACDSRDRVVFCNSGAAELLGRRVDEVLGRHCYEVVGGRDVFGNRFCYANCPVMSGLRGGEAISGFEISVSGNGHGRFLTNVTILRVPSVRPDLFTVVHVLQPIEPDGRLARLLAQTGTTSAPATEAWPPAALAPAPPGPPLTGRERQVLERVARGLQNKEIAQRLDLSLATVRNHIHNILGKLGVHSKLEAVSLAFRSGWVAAEDAAGQAPRSEKP